MCQGFCRPKTASSNGPIHSTPTTTAERRSAVRQRSPNGRGSSAVPGSSAGSSRGQNRHQATNHTTSTAFNETYARWVCAVNEATATAATSAPGDPCAVSQTRKMVRRKASNGRCETHRSTVRSGPMPRISTATSAIVASRRGHLPRRQASAPRPATTATLTIAAVQASERGSPLVSRYSGSAIQNSSGPGWAQPLTLSKPISGVSREPTCEVRQTRPAQSPVGNHEVSPSATAAITIGLAATATTPAMASHAGHAAADCPHLPPRCS